MKKVTKKLELNKQVVANLNSIMGGDTVKTSKCVSGQCVSILCPEPTVTFACNSEVTKVASGCIWTTDYTCTPSNGETCGITETYVSCPCTTAGC